MPDLETLRQKLADRNIQAVAKGAGLHPNAVYRLLAGTSHPRYETVQKLIEYLNNQHQKAA